MVTLKGKGVSAGVAFGVYQLFKRDDTKVERAVVEDAAAEVQRFESARALAAAQLGKLAVETEAKLGKENSLLFEIHQMMLEDLDYRESVVEMIEAESVKAEWAVSETATNFARMFSEMDDEYMRGRAADVQDVSQRVIQILTGRVDVDQFSSDREVLIVSDDFAPSETAQFDKEKVKAMVLSAGSGNSHSAIFARTMGIPCIILLGEEALAKDLDGKSAALDGETGEVFVEPDDETVARLQAKLKEQEAFRELLEQYRGKPSQTPDGRSVKIFANIGSVDDAEVAVTNDAEGVGLFRSEFLYLESNDYPTEAQQFDAYKAVAQKMNGKLVVIRTLDIGADKQAAYFNLPEEENPALGMRAIRICLTRPEIFKTQMRALYRASAYGKIAVMFPMITSSAEVRRAKLVAAEVRAELEAEGIPFDAEMALGIMIETPASAVISDVLAKEVDFFSIGTNDLTQYTLAIDRQNEALDEFFDAHHEAVLRLIKMAVDSAHAAGIWCGICGELGADLSLTKTFLDMGVDELSVTPSAVLPLRKQVSETQ